MHALLAELEEAYGRWAARAAEAADISRLADTGGVAHARALAYQDAAATVHLLIPNLGDEKP